MNEPIDTDAVRARWRDIDGYVVDDMDALCDEVDRLRAALREVHDRSLLPFDDNDRRWIGERARAALLGAPGGES